MGTSGRPHPAVILRVRDGDTCDVQLDLDFHITYQSACRVYGINAPENSTPEGKAATAFAKTLLWPGLQVTVVNFGDDKYGGRFDGQIFLPDGRDFAQVMIDAGHAAPRNYGVSDELQ